MLTRQAKRLAKEKNSERTEKTVKICRKYMLRLVEKKDGAKNKARTKQGKERRSD